MLGLESELFEIDAEIAVKDIMQQLSLRGGHWQKCFSSQDLLVAINQNIAKTDAILKGGEELAIYPPVTGG